MLFFSILSLLILFIFFVFFSQVDIHNKYKSNFLIFSLAMFFCLLASSRLLFDTQSDDLIRYYNDYANIKAVDFFDYIANSPREILFDIYNWLLYQGLGADDVRLYLFFVIAPTMLFKVFAIRNVSPENFKMISVLLCGTAVSSLTYDTQLIRQAMALSILFFGISLADRRIMLLCFLISFFIHNSMVLFVFLFYFSFSLRTWFIRTKGNAVILFLIISFVGQGLFEFIIEDFLLVISNHVPFLNEKLGFVRLFLSSGESKSFSLSSFTYLSFLWSYVGLFFYFKFNNGYAEKVEVFLTFVLLLFSFILFTSSIPEMTMRFSSYILLFSPLYLLVMIDTLKVEYVHKRISVLFFSSLYLLIFIINITSQTSFVLFDSILSS